MQRLFQRMSTGYSTRMSDAQGSLRFCSYSLQTMETHHGTTKENKQE